MSELISYVIINERTKMLGNIGKIKLNALKCWIQARYDRDKYVEVTLDNVSPRYVDDFAKINKSIADTRGFAYDYSSIMHYSERTFTNNGLKTIKAWYLHFFI